MTTGRINQVTKLTINSKCHHYIEFFNNMQ
jgi:hypothetical protein